MREFKKRRTVGADLLRVGLGSAGILALAAVAFGTTRAAWDMYGTFAEAAAVRATSETELHDLEERHRKISSDVEVLSSERGLETQVRERYGVAKPGEEQISIVRQASSTEVLRQEKGFLEKLWQSLVVW